MLSSVPRNTVLDSARMSAEFMLQVSMGSCVGYASGS